LDIWYREVELIVWESPNHLKSQFGGSVSILKNSRAVFDVKGNDYRIVAAINYLNASVFIKFIGTHSQYDRIDANTIDMFHAKKKKI
jgi:mRNA interferase HigB